MLESYYRQLSKSVEKKLTIILIIGIILTIGVMRYLDTPLKNDVCKHGITSFELAKDVNKTVAIINSWDEHAKISVSISMGFDFLFILVYTTLIALLIYKVSKSFTGNHFVKRIGIVLLNAIFFAGLLDIVENIALIKLLFGEYQQIWSSIAYYFASVKFAIVLVCLIYIILNSLWLLFKKVR
jgi:hypothetical protein